MLNYLINKGSGAHVFSVLLSLVFFLGLPLPAFAYIGPGMAGGAVVAAFGLIVAFFAVLLGLFYYPLKRLLKRKKKKPEHKE